MKQFALLLLGAGLLLGCQKDDILFVGTNTNPALSAVAQRNAPAKQVFSFALNQPQTIRTAAGATLRFPANAFRRPDGLTLATGQAELRVRELYAVPDMLLADMPTTAANGQVLISGGEFVIQVWQGTSRLRLPAAPAPTGAAVGLVLTSPVPLAGLDTTRMQLWNQPARTFATAIDSGGWVRAAGPGRIPIANGQYVVTLPLDSIGSWNIDQFWHAYQTAASVAATVEVPTGAAETRVYFRPVGYNGLARGTAATPAATRWASLLPAGARVVAVVLQHRAGQLYYGTQALTVQAGQIVQPPMEALSEAEIIRRIRLL